MFCGRLFLEKEELECREEEQNILGQGGSGTVVYRASYRGKPVAVKRFHFKKCRQHTISVDTGDTHARTKTDRQMDRKPPMMTP